MLLITAVKFQFPVLITADITCKYIEVLVTRKIVHTLNARRTQLTYVFRKKNKEMLI